MLSSHDNAATFGFGVAAISYGICSILLVFLAWVQPAPRLASVAKAIGLTFFVLWLLGCLDSRGLQGLEWVGVVTVAGIVAVTQNLVSLLVTPNSAFQRRGCARR